MEMDYSLYTFAAAAVTAVTLTLICHFRYDNEDYQLSPDWQRIGIFLTRDPERHSRLERNLLPRLTGIPNEVPLYQHRRIPTLFAYRIHEGPWINPTPEEVERYLKPPRDY